MNCHSRQTVEQGTEWPRTLFHAQRYPWPVRTGGTRWAIVSCLFVSTMLFACTGPPVAIPTSSTSSPRIRFARYFFSASGIGGVLEVSSAPPSICYSTQSYPARPIAIIPGPSQDLLARAEVSYAPNNNDFCDRTVQAALASSLIADPSGYQVRWRPRPGGPTAFSSLIPEPPASP